MSRPNDTVQAHVGVAQQRVAPETAKIVVTVINDDGNEVMKVFEV